MLGLLASPASAAPGDLDTAFDGDGIATVNVGDGPAPVRISALVRQDDGKLVAGGTTSNGSIRSQFVIARYNADGSLDSGFGGGDGVVIITVGKYSSFVNDLAIQGDGKIVAVGWAYRDFGVVRLNADGSLDGSFGESGIVTTDFDSNVDLANAVAIDDTGRIVVGGSARDSSHNDDFAVARYNANGSLDTSFSGDGLTTTAFPAGFADEIFALEIAADDKIIAAGDGSGDFGLARYGADGVLDTTFGTDGLVTTDFGGADEAADLAIAGTGEITVVGKGDGDLAIARYTSGGALDPSFDSDGMLTTDEENLNGGTGVVLSGGKTVVSATNSGAGDFALARFNGDGSLDTSSDADPGTSLDGDGIVKTDLSGGNDYAYDLLEQPDGKLVLGGVAEAGGLERFGLARYNANGSLDTSFDDNGIESNSFDVGSTDAAHAVAETPGGKLVVAGDISFGGPLDFLVMRFNPDGSLDNSFDGDGIAITDLGSADSARAVAVQADGKILVGGSAGDFTGKDFAVVRYNVDGSLDTDDDADPGSDWGFDGVVTEDLGGTADTVRALAVQPDGKVVAAGLGDGGFGLARFDEFGDLDDTFDGESDADGSFTTDFGASNTVATDVVVSGGSIVAAGSAGSLTDFALARYDISDGKLDTSFDSDGLVTTDVGAGNPDAIEAIALQGDGKIVASGWSNSGASSGGIDFALARYNTDGTLDTDFDSDGKVVTSFEGDNEERALGVAVQADGKIVAGGYASESTLTQPGSFALARYESTGGLDSSFDGDGKLTTDLGSSSSAADLLLTSGGKIVMAGRVFNGPDDVALARYETGGVALATQTLDVTLTGDGEGRVTGPGIDCPGDCTQEYAPGTAVALTATSSAGSTFEGWAGDCAGGGACALTMDVDRQVSASFAAEPDPGPSDPGPGPANPAPGPSSPAPPPAPDFPGHQGAEEVDGVGAFDLELDVTKKGVIVATVRASQRGRLVATATTRKGGKRFSYKKRKGSVKPHKEANLRLKPPRSVKKLLKRSRRPQAFGVTVKYLPAAGKVVYKQRSEVKADIGGSKKIARWVQVYVGTSTRYTLDSVRGMVVSGTLGFGRADAMVPTNSKVPKKLDGLARKACANRKPTVELLLQSPTGRVYSNGPVLGRPTNTKFNGPTAWENNIWPRLGKGSDEWSVLVRTGWPRQFGMGAPPSHPKVKFKGMKRTVFCSGSQVSFPQPFVPDPRD